MKGWRPALLALALSMAGAAEDWNGAARELARRTAAATRGEPVAIAWRNLSSLGSGQQAQARAAFDAALREAGGRAVDTAPAAEAQITISENATSYLLVEELRKGDDRQVWVVSASRANGAPPAGAGATVEKRLLWEQDEPILDVAAVGEGLLVLTPSALVRTAPRQSAPIPAVKRLARDPRGRIRVRGLLVEVNLPGMLCSGSLEGPLTLSCRASDEPWTLESDGRALLLATYAANRNYFDGRVVTQTGLRKTVAPFYSAASADEGGRAVWLLTMIDGRVEIFDAAMEPAGSIPQWGSDIAGAGAHCGGGSVVLATRPGGGPDAIQAYAIVNRAAVAIAEPVETPGPVMALWPPGVAVVRNGAKGNYQAYGIKVTCAP